jgi:hypothetical protein
MTTALLSAFAGRAGSAAQYIAVHRVFSAFGVLGPVTLVIDAPFGRFSLKQSIFNINGNLGWVRLLV